jgi:catechol 2,3-dioxygenase-like lactoylglutathione lyase family enzyme
MLGGSDCVATIAVSDQEAARKFYEGVLGLEQAMESPGGVFYKSGKTGVFVYPSEYAGSNKALLALPTKAGKANCSFMRRRQQVLIKPQLPTGTWLTLKAL